MLGYWHPPSNWLVPCSTAHLHLLNPHLYNLHVNCKQVNFWKGKIILLSKVVLGLLIFSSLETKILSTDSGPLDLISYFHLVCSLWYSLTAFMSAPKACLKTSVSGLYVYCFVYLNFLEAHSLAPSSSVGLGLSIRYLWCLITLCKIITLHKHFTLGCFLFLQSSQHCVKGHIIFICCFPKQKLDNDLFCLLL